MVRRGVQSADQPPRRHHCTAELTSEGPRRSGSPGMQPRRKQSRELPRILLMRVQGLTFSTAFRAKKSEDFGPVTRKPICKFASCFNVFDFDFDFVRKRLGAPHNKTEETENIKGKERIKISTYQKLCISQT